MRHHVRLKISKHSLIMCADVISQEMPAGEKHQVLRTDNRPRASWADSLLLSTVFSRCFVPSSTFKAADFQIIKPGKSLKLI
jgi:hypothetical protein